MKAIGVLLIAGLVLAEAPDLRAQVAGSTLLGVEASELREITLGWSARRQILHQGVFNDKGERIGAVDDIIIAPDKSVSYAIIAAGGFLGVVAHDVAVPVTQLKLIEGKLVLAGASREALKALPAFEYARRG